MRRLTMVMGLPGSGKTTFSLSLSGTVIHIDEVRKNMTGTYTPGDHESSVYQRILHLAETAMHQQQPVVIDGALLSSQRREVFIKLAKKHDYHIAVYWLDLSLSLLEKRLMNRNVTASKDRQIRPSYLYKLMQYVEPPSEQEGIDELYYVSDEDVT